MKMIYVEPKEYITPSMKKILEEGEKKDDKKPEKKASQSLKKQKKRV